MKSITITFGLLCFAGFVFADRPVTGPSGTVCESPGGSCIGIPDGTNIPYKNNCSKFIQCFLECGCDKECSGGLHFNSKLQVCDWPASAGCDPSCANSPCTPGTGCESPGDSCKNVTDGTLIPDEKDCSKYIQCSNGCEHSKNCPPGTHFSSKLQACTWPSQAGCDPSYVDPPCESPGGKCKNVTDGTLIPDEKDCSKYIQCSKGCEYSKNCPSGTHFCPNIQGCTLPSQAGCDPSYVDPPCESPGIKCKNVTDGTLIPDENDCSKYIQCSKGCEHSKNCPCGTHFCPNLQECTLPSQAGCDPSYVDPPPCIECESPGDKCKNVTDGTLIPDESDCSKYIQCSKGCENSKNCPSGLHFCPNLPGCTLPSQAGCDPSYVDPPTRPPGNGCKSPGDSCTNIEDGILMAYENDCTRFIECSRGCANDKKCPSGMHFCPTLQMCTSPSKAGCDPSYIDRPPKPSETVCESSGGSCKNIKDGTLIAYKNDCSKFIECSKGCGNDKKCTSGMHFSSKLQGCTLPSRAGCDPSYVAPPPETATTVCASEGLCNNRKDGVLIPYENYCNMFLECFMDCGIIRECPSGMFFNSKLQGCILLPDTGCTPSPNPKPTPGAGQNSCSGKEPGKLLSFIGNCSKYIACGEGNAYIMDCGSQFHFNSALEICDWPESAGCDLSYVKPEPIPSCKSKGASCSGVDTGKLLPYAGNCTKFVACVSGCAFDMNCGNGLHFNKALQACDCPNKAGCDLTISSNSTSCLCQECSDSAATPVCSCA